MNRTALVTALLVGSATLAQIRIEVAVPLPTITFQAPPPLVLVSPGVQVVEDYDDEVFVIDNVYWCRRGERWYRSADHRGSWVVVEHHAVPTTIVRVPPGHYRRWKHGRSNTTVVIDPPGPGKVKIKKHGKHDKR